MRDLTITMVHQDFTGPKGQEVVTHTDAVTYLDIDQVQGAYTGYVPLEPEDIAFQIQKLLWDAQSSGYEVTVRNVSDPRLGMGGHHPEVTIRPNFPAMRRKMAQLAAEPAGAVRIAEHGVGKTNDIPPEQIVRPVYHAVASKVDHPFARLRHDE